MKITFILPRFDPKPVGGFKIVYEYANQLVAQGYEITIVHPRQLVRNNTRRLTMVYHWLTKKQRQSGDTTLLPEVPWHPVDNRIKMLHVPEPSAAYVPDGDAVFATYFPLVEYAIDYPQEKVRAFYFVQGYSIWGGPKKRVDAAWRAPLVKIVISRWLYDQGRKLGVPADEMIHIPNGIDHARYRIIHPIENRPSRMAMLYHTLPLKGAEYGIRALEIVRREFPALQAVLFGVFPRPEGLPSWIEYHYDPPQEELIGSIYNGSSIYLSPSWSEGWGLPHAEAMACGRALSSTDSGGVRDFAEHGVTALLSSPKDPRALAENILRLLKDDNLRIRLAEAGYERIQEFTWERSTNLLEQFIINRIRRPRTRGKV